MNEAQKTLIALGFFTVKGRPGTWVSDSGTLIVKVTGESIEARGQTFTPHAFWVWCLM